MAVNNSLANRPKKMDFGVYLTQDAAKQQINRLLGGQAGTRFISAIVAAVQANPTLAECSNPSILSAALQGEALKLSPSPQLGQYYMVPFNNKKKDIKEAQFQLGYKGYVQLAIRSGQYKKLNVLAIKEGELIRYDPLNEEIDVQLIESDTAREKAPTIGYYAMFEYITGYKKILYWSKEKMAAHAEQFSQAFFTKGGMETLRLIEAGKIPEKDMWQYSSFWFKNFDDMALKTMLRQLISKWGVMSIELQKAYESDMAVIHEDGTTEYVDNAEAYIDEGTVSDTVPEDNASVQETDTAPGDDGVADSFFNS